MNETKQHTIRFATPQKEKIKNISKLEDRSFQEQVAHMLNEQLRDKEVVYFLRRVEIILDSLDETEQKELMAKIANLVDLTLEV